MKKYLVFCDLCRESIEPYERLYYIDGTVICDQCLEPFAKQYFLSCRTTAHLLTGRYADEAY